MYLCIHMAGEPADLIQRDIKPLQLFRLLYPVHMEQIGFPGYAVRHQMIRPDGHRTDRFRPFEFRKLLSACSVQ